MKRDTSSMYAAIVAVIGLSTAACSSKPDFPETPTPDAGTPPPVMVVDAGPPPPVAPVGCDAVQGAAFASIFAGRIATEAPRMEADGAVVCGVVGQEGGTITGPTFFLQPGYCYTVLGNALPNVSELDLAFVADLTAAGIPPAFAALANAPIAVDSDTGAMAAIGAKNQCYKWPWPFPGAVKLVVKSRIGAGPVGAQVYKKKSP